MPKNNEVKFDTAWMETLDFSSPEAVKKAFQEKAEEFNAHAGNLHAGMTKAQQEAADLRKRADIAAQYEKWRDDGNVPLLTRWGEIRRFVDQHGVDGLFQRLQQQARAEDSPTNPKSPEMRAAKEVQRAFDAKEISWEDAQEQLAQISTRLQGLDEVNNWYRTELPKLKTEFPGMVQENTRALLQYMQWKDQQYQEAMEYKHAHPERNVREVFQAMADPKNQGRSWVEVAKDLFYEQDRDSEIESEREKLRKENEATLAAERENWKREQEARGVGTDTPPALGSISGGVYHVQRDPNNTARATRSPQDFAASVLKKVTAA